MGLRYGRIIINGRWWKWDKEKEVLKHGRSIEKRAGGGREEKKEGRMLDDEKG